MLLLQGGRLRTLRTKNHRAKAPHGKNRHAPKHAVCLHGNVFATREYLYTLSNAEAANDNIRGFRSLRELQKLLADDKYKRLTGQKVQRRLKKQKNSYFLELYGRKPLQNQENMV